MPPASVAVHGEHWYFLSILASVFLFSFFLVNPPSQLASISLPSDLSPIPPECPSYFLSEVEKFTVSYRRCLVKRLKNTPAETSIWKHLPATIRYCLARKKFSKYLNGTRIGSPKVPHRSKFVILPPSKNSSCVIVTARTHYFGGYGSADREMCRLAPKCELHVADPVWFPRLFNRGKFYQKVIKYAEIDYQKRFQSSQRLIIPNENVEYSSFITLKYLLENEINVSPIDYLWIDYVKRLGQYEDGKHYFHATKSFPEYSIFQEPFNITVCQVSIFHRIDGVDIEIGAFKDHVLSAISKPLFLPIHSEFIKENNAVRTTYMNMSNPYCLEKFVAPTFCADQRDYILEAEWKKFQDMIEQFEKELEKIEDDFYMTEE